MTLYRTLIATFLVTSAGTMLVFDADLAAICLVAGAALGWLAGSTRTEQPAKPTAEEKPLIILEINQNDEEEEFTAIDNLPWNWPQPPRVVPQPQKPIARPPAIPEPYAQQRKRFEATIVPRTNGRKI